MTSRVVGLATSALARRQLTNEGSKIITLEDEPFGIFDKLLKLVRVMFLSPYRHSPTDDSEQIVRVRILQI